MISEKLHAEIRKHVKVLQHYVDKIWYAPLIGLLAALDNLILIVPNDGILISSSMLRPKRWFVLALFVAVGSTLGAIALAALVEFYGLPWVLETFPGIDETKTWVYSHDFFQKYGLIFVFAMGITPLIQQPAVILASLAETPLWKLTVAVFVGRFAKFLFMAYLGSHAPRMLERIWGLKGELQDAGVK